MEKRTAKVRHIKPNSKMAHSNTVLSTLVVFLRLHTVRLTGRCFSNGSLAYLGVVFVISAAGLVS